MLPVPLRVYLLYGIIADMETVVLPGNDQNYIVDSSRESVDSSAHRLTPGHNIY